LLGIEDPHTLRIDTKYPEAAPVPAFDGVALRTNTDHPAMLAQIAEADKAKADLALKRSQLWPSAAADSSYRFGNDYSEPFQDRWLSVLSVSVPVFDFGERYLAQQAADQKYQAQKEEILKVHQDVRQAIFDAIAHLVNAREHEASDAIILAERQLTFDRLNELSKYQMAPIPELLQSEINLLEAKRLQEEDKLQVSLSSANLEKVSAGEWKWIR
jgi:outer membrane protein TolC